MTRKLFFIIYLIVISAVGLEATSFAVVWFYSRDPKLEHLRYHVQRFHPLFQSGDDLTGTPLPPTERMDDSNPFRLDPMTAYRNKPHRLYMAKLPIDANGFVCNKECTPLPREKPKNEARVFIFGGSSVAGAKGVDGSGTISGQLETELNKLDLFNGRTVRVINAGLGGAFSAQELALFVNDVIHYKPDFVIFFDGYNDYGMWYYNSFYPFIDQYKEYLSPYMHRYGYATMKGVDRIQTISGSLLHTANMISNAVPVFYYTTVLAKHIRVSHLKLGQNEVASNIGWSTATNENKPKNSPNIDALLHRLDRPSVSTYMQNLRSASGVAKSSGIKALLCLQPTLPFRDASGKPRKRDITADEAPWIDKTSWEDGSNFINAYFNEAQNGIRELAKTNDDDVNFCDLTDMFANESETMFTDEIHYNGAGNVVIARTLANKMKAQLHK